MGPDWLLHHELILLRLALYVDMIYLKWGQQRSCSLDLVGQVRIKDHFKKEVSV